MSDNDEESDEDDSDDRGEPPIDQLKEIKTALEVIKLAAQLVDMWK